MPEGFKIENKSGGEVIEKPAVEDEKSPGLSRREFLRGGTALAGILLLGGKAEAAKGVLSRFETGKEKTPKGPKIKFDVFYYTHATAEDTKPLKKKIKTCDIYVPEAPGWSSDSLLQLEKVSQGKMTPESFLRSAGLSPKNDSFYMSRLEELKGLYNSRKKIAMVDIPSNHPNFWRHHIIDGKLDTLTLDSSFMSNLSRFRELKQEEAELTREREAIILENLDKLKKDIADGKFPLAKRDKKDVRVLLALGAAHTRIYHHLKRKDEETSWSFSEMPFIYGSSGVEVLRRGLFEKTINDELLARAMLEKIVGPTLLGNLHIITENTNKAARFMQKVIREFNFAEVKEMFEEVRVARNPHKELHRAFFAKMVKKGYKLPSSEKELNDAISEKSKGSVPRF